jgi:hypothetical protein
MISTNLDWIWGRLLEFGAHHFGVTLLQRLL